jgi:hypothetical protein
MPGIAPLLPAAHHDLKARNFVRFFNGHYKVIDFDARCFADGQVGKGILLRLCPPMCTAVLQNALPGHHTCLDLQ